MPMQFGQLLSLYREKNDLTQKQLSALVPMNQSYLSRIERGLRKPPQRNTVLTMVKALELSEQEADDLLAAANYQPKTLFDLGFDAQDSTLKQIVNNLSEIKNKSQLASYLRAKEEILDYLEFLKLKYTQRINKTISKNSLVAELVYSKVRRGGLKALFEFLNKPMGGAVIMLGKSILLTPIGIGPNKGTWFIPAGFVNEKKGDKTAKDIALRLANRYLGDIELQVVKELTAPSEPLEELDTVEYCVKAGYHLPIIAQIYEIKIKNKTKLKTRAGARFIPLNQILKFRGDFYPLLDQVLKPYIKNKKVLKEIYLREEELLRKLVSKKNYFEEIDRFYNARIKR